MELDGRSFDYEPVKPSRQNRIMSEGASSDHESPKLEADLLKNRVDSLEDAQPDIAPGTPRHEKPALTTEVWSKRRGHTLTFIALFVYVAIAYFRPYELTSLLSWTVWFPYWLAFAMVVIFVVTQFALEGNLTARPREVNLVLLLTVTALLSIPLAASAFDAWDMFNKVFVKTVLLFVIMVNVLRSERQLKMMIFLSLWPPASI